MPIVQVEIPAAMPFGKYRDWLFEDLPSDYIRWVLREATNAEPWLLKDLRKELDRRREELNGVEYVVRAGSQVVHLSIGGDPPLCGAWWSFRGNERHYVSFPDGQRSCAKGCFR